MDFLDRKCLKIQIQWIVFVPHAEAGIEKRGKVALTE